MVYRKIIACSYICCHLYDVYIYIYSEMNDEPPRIIEDRKTALIRSLVIELQSVTTFEKRIGVRKT